MAISPSRNGAAYRNILLIRTDRVGDLILSTPAIASFRRSWPHARITAVVTGYTEPVLRHNPDIDDLVLLPNRSPVQAIARVVQLGKSADIAVGLAPRTDDIFLAGITAAPTRIGYVYRRRYLSRVLAQLALTDWCLSEADPDLADRFPDQPILHEVHQVLALVKLAGGGALTEDLTLRLGDDDTAWAAANAPAGAVVLALAPRWFARNFGADAVKRLISSLARANKDVIITYGNETHAGAASVRAGLNASNVTWLGDLALLRWAAVLAQSAIVVTVDTGATHVAAALGRPVVVIFEREHFRLSSQEWGPWRVPNAMLTKPPHGAEPGPLIDDVVAAARALGDRHGSAAPS
ncbi:MAG TPA: glycosyltransferase family 9 protein [Candidatus Eremiobacteraceae bacterium]|nr:glycosyltransferase family 9 protein [Candidatus Eremiobacteraceae bacterium]